MNLPAASVIASRAAALLALLLAGHVLADFLVQSGRVAREKSERRGILLRHGALTLVAQAIVVWPCWNPLVLCGVAAVAVLHTLIDGLKLGAERRGLAPLPAFLLDQAVHVALIAFVWHGLVRMDAHEHAWVRLERSDLAAYARWAVIGAGVVFNAKGGTAIVRRLLEQYPQVLPAEGAPAYAMGRTIGVLERLLLYALVLLEQWSALGFVVAAKSIARFRELESKHFADYYLVGTLTSLLVAIASGILVRCVVGR
jgi:hypothetical protein